MKSNITTAEVVATAYINVMNGPEYKVEVIRYANRQFGARCWQLEFYQVEIPDTRLPVKKARKYDKCHVHILDESTGFPVDSSLRFRSPKSAITAAIARLREQLP